MKNLIIVLLINLFSISISAQLTPQEAVELMGKGINLGNTLDGIPSEGDWYPELTQEYYFKAYKDAGFTNVRIPVTWQNHFIDDPFYIVDTSWMDRVEEIVDWGLAQGLFITLNAHHDGWIKHEYTARNIQKFDSLWSQIAVRFKDKSDRLVFEMLNEPEDMTVTQLNETNTRILEIIRKTNPTRIVLFSGNGWTASNDLLEIDVPDVNDNYLMGYFHAYDPWEFVGGNASWTGTASQVNSLKANMQKVQDWSTLNNIPVILNEWGATHNCDYNEKMKYLAIYGNIILDYGFAYSYWDDGGLFRLYEREDNTWDDVKDVLIHCSNHTPMNLAYNVTDTIITLTWENRINTDSVSIDSTVIERKTERIGPFTPISTIAGEETYTDSTSKKAGQNYYYRVINYLADGSFLISYPQMAYIICNERSPFDESPIKIPGTVEAEDFDRGCNGLTYNEADPANQGEAYRLEEPVDIEARSDGFQVGYTVKGEWLEYTVDVEEGGDYTVTSLTATQKSGCVMGLEMDGESIARISVPNTGSWTTIDEVKENITLNAGVQILRINILSENPFNIDKLTFTKGHTATNSDLNESPFTVYPNPASDQLTIAGHNIEAVTFAIKDINGRILLSIEPTDEKQSIDISSLKSGIYFITVSTTENSYSKKLIVK